MPVIPNIIGGILDQWKKKSCSGLVNSSLIKVILTSFLWSSLSTSTSKPNIIETDNNS